MTAAGRRTKKPSQPRPGYRLSLRCSCGGTVSSQIALPPSVAIQIRDIYLSFHREDGCIVTDTSEDVS